MSIACPKGPSLPACRRRIQRRRSQRAGLYYNPRPHSTSLMPIRDKTLPNERAAPMKRAVWLTDIHLNFLKAAEIEVFLRSVVAASPDILLIGGDVGEAPDVIGHLRRI